MCMFVVHSRVHACTYMLAITMMSICFVGVSFLFIITVVIFVLYMYMYMYCFCALVPTPQLTHPVVIFFMKHKRKQIPV